VAHQQQHQLTIQVVSLLMTEWEQAPLTPLPVALLVLLPLLQWLRLCMHCVQAQHRCVFAALFLHLVSALSADLDSDDRDLLFMRWLMASLAVASSKHFLSAKVSRFVCSNDNMACMPSTAGKGAGACAEQPPG